MVINKHGAVLFTFLFCSHLGSFCWYKTISQCLHGKLHSVPQFVAEVTVTQNAVDIQVDVPACETNTGMKINIKQVGNVRTSVEVKIYF